MFTETLCFFCLFCKQKIEIYVWVKLNDLYKHLPVTAGLAVALSFEIPLVIFTGFGAAPPAAIVARRLFTVFGLFILFASSFDSESSAEIFLITLSVSRRPFTGFAGPLTAFRNFFIKAFRVVSVTGKFNPIDFNWSRNSVLLNASKLSIVKYALNSVGLSIKYHTQCVCVFFCVSILPPNGFSLIKIHEKFKLTRIQMKYKQTQQQKCKKNPTTFFVYQLNFFNKKQI